ncbi:hypothetical protein ACRSLK_01465 [Halopseudomonas pachastrellae]
MLSGVQVGLQSKNVMIENPAGKYAPISAADYLLQRIQANFAEAKK